MMGSDNAQMGMMSYFVVKMLTILKVKTYITENFIGEIALNIILIALLDFTHY